MTLPRGGRGREVIENTLIEAKELRRGRCWKEKRGFSAKERSAIVKPGNVKFASGRLENVKLVRERHGRGR